MRALVAPSGRAALAAVLLAACQDSSLPTPPSPGGLPSLSVVAGAPPEWTFHEPGYEANIIATGLSRPQGVVRLGDGVLFSSETFGPDFAEDASQVTRVLPTGERARLASIPPIPGFRMSMVDLVRDGAGGFFASLIIAGRIYHVTMSGGVTEYATVPRAPTFLAVGPDWRLYVNQVTGDVVRIEAGGTLAAIVDAPADARLRGITFDDEGRLYVLANEDLSTAPRTTLRRFHLSIGPLPLPLASGIVITDALPMDAPQEAIEDLLIWPAGGGDFFTVDAHNVYRVRPDGSVSVFIAGLVRGTTFGAFNALALSGSGDLLVTEYPIGRVTEVRRR